MTRASTVWRDYNTDGVSGSGKLNPLKSTIRSWALIAEKAALTPEHFGAVGDGSADDASAIQDWLDELVSEQVCGVARGVYRLDSTVTISDPDNIHVDARGSNWTTAVDTLMIDVNGKADPTYVDNESRQNFTWIGGEFTCTASSPTDAAAFRMLGMREAVLAPGKVDGFANGIVTGGKDTVLIENVKFYNNTIDILFPPWSTVGGPLIFHLWNLHHSHPSSSPCIKSYVPLSDSSIIGGSYNLGSGTTATAVDIQKCVLIGVSGSITGTFTAGETVTGGTSGATMTLIEVYTHPNAFTLSQPTQYLVGSDRTGTFVGGETLTGGTSSATATAAADTGGGHITQNIAFRELTVAPAHIESGSGAAAGAIGISLRDRIKAGTASYNMTVRAGGLALAGGNGSIGVKLEGIIGARISGYFSQESGDTTIQTDADCEDIKLCKPYYDIGGTIDLNSMSRSELDMSEFSQIIAPTAVGISGSLSAGATTTATVTPTGAAAATIGGLKPKALDLRVSLLGTTMSSGTNVRVRFFATGVTASASKWSHQAAGGIDSDYHWASTRVALDTNGQFERDGQNSGGGTVSYNAPCVGIHY